MNPAGTTPSYLLGILAMLLGQLCFSINDALIKYKQCAMLDQGMEICRTRTEKLTREIAELKQEHYNSCLRYLEVQQYDQALASCEMVLQLEPNETVEIHKGAKQGIIKAKAALNINY